MCDCCAPHERMAICLYPGQLRLLLNIVSVATMMPRYSHLSAVCAVLLWLR
eukprot:m.192859 g.192859  ORF g.192859 m.192859 type:complete len:51 (-) comp15173_c0_seq10:758-910(-)